MNCRTAQAGAGCDELRERHLPRPSPPVWALPRRRRALRPQEGVPARVLPGVAPMRVIGTAKTGQVVTSRVTELVTELVALTASPCATWPSVRYRVRYRVRRETASVRRRSDVRYPSRGRAGACARARTRARPRATRMAHMPPWRTDAVSCRT